MKKKNFGKAVRWVLTVVAIAALSSCLDVVQTIEQDGAETVTRIRLSFSKALLEGAASMSGEEPNYDDLPDFTGEEGMVNTEIPGARVETFAVDTASDYGMMIEARYRSSNLRAVDPAERVFFPLVEDRRIEILLPPNDEQDEMDDMTAMFFGGAKYRIYLAKDSPRTRIREVLVGGVPDLASVWEMRDIYIIEIPLHLWLASSDLLPIEILF